MVKWEQDGSRDGSQQGFRDESAVTHRGKHPERRGTTVGMTAELRFVRQLLVKLNAGLSLEKSLAALGVETKDRRLRTACKDLHAQVVLGYPLALAMREQKYVFDDCVICLVERAEQNGTVAAALPSVAQYLERIGSLRQAMHRALDRPLNVLAIVLLAIFISVVGLAFLVRETLPDASGARHMVVSRADQIAIMVAGLVRVVWPLVAVAGALCFLTLRLAPRHLKSRARLDLIALKLPLIAGAVRWTGMACFTRSVGILMSSGAALWEAMQLGAGAVTNLSMRETIACTIDKIEKGRPYLEALVDAGFLRRRDVNIVQVAERRGTLADAMLTIADGYEREAVDHVRRLATLVQSGSVLVAGGAIVIAVLTLYVPVFILR
jgi:type II secretory pathway component PulF